MLVGGAVDVVAPMTSTFDLGLVASVRALMPLAALAGRKTRLFLPPLVVEKVTVVGLPALLPGSLALAVVGLLPPAAALFPLPVVCGCGCSICIFCMLILCSLAGRLEGDRPVGDPPDPALALFNLWMMLPAGSLPGCRNTLPFGEQILMFRRALLGTCLIVAAPPELVVNLMFPRIWGDVAAVTTVAAVDPAPDAPPITATPVAAPPAPFI